MKKKELKFEIDLLYSKLEYVYKRLDKLESPKSEPSKQCNTVASEPSEEEINEAIYNYNSGDRSSYLKDEAFKAGVRWALDRGKE